MVEKRSFRDRYPAPWTVEETPGGFAVVSSNGVRIAYIYILADPASKGLSRIEALAVARAIAGIAERG